MTQRNLVLPLVGLSLPIFMFAIDMMALTVGLNTIIQEFGVGIHLVQWLLTAYAIGNAAFYVTMGRMADKFGRRRMMLIGVFLFTLFSITAALSSNIYFLIASRALQGIAGSILLTSSMSLIAHLYEGDERAYMLGKWVMIAAVGGAVGPIIGGILIYLSGWRAIFYINLPIGFLAWFMVRAYVKKDVVEACQERFDFLGLIFLTLFLVAIVLGFSEGNTWGWASTYSYAAFIFSAIFLAIFILAEYIVKFPLIDFKLFTHRNFIAGTSVGFLFYFFFFVWMFIFGIYMQQGFGLSPLCAGLSFLPLSIVFAIGSSNVSKAIKKFGNKRTIIVSGLISFVAFVGLTFINAGTNYLYLSVFFLLLGIGLVGLTTPTLMLATQCVPSSKTGVASGVILTIRWLGSALGLAIFAAVYQGIAHANLMSHINTEQVGASKVILLDKVLADTLPIHQLKNIFSTQSLPKIQGAVHSALAHGASISMLCLAVLALLCAIWSWLMIEKDS